MKTALTASCSLLLLAATSSISHAQLIWTVGLDDGGQPCTQANPCTGGGATANFVQENGTINVLPGVPNSPSVDRSSDNDYYFAGSFITTIDSVVALYGGYTPVGTVAANEESAERAFAGNDNDLRYHFNLPDTLQPTDLLSIKFDTLSLDTGGHSDPRYGIEVYFNGVLVQTQIVIRPLQLNHTLTTPQFTLQSVNGQVGPGFDNIVSLKGYSYSGDGGGAWMGIDFVQLNHDTVAIPNPTFPWQVGKDDNTHAVGNGGGTNATFVQENGVVNPLPGIPNSPEADGQADNDYYFAGNYVSTIPSVVSRYGAYSPVGLVPANEEAAERAFAGGDNDLRYHFNLPNELSPSQLVAVTFEPLDLDNTGSDPRYGVEVYFNGVLVQPEVLIRPSQLHQAITTPSFTLGSVNAAMGSGNDNIVSLKAHNYGADGGGNWMGIDYVKLDTSTLTVPLPVLPWSVGKDDDSWAEGDGGGPNATFLPGQFESNPLPGNPANEEFEFDPDNDYYFGGSYTSVIPGNGSYTPVGPVYANEEAMRGGFTDGVNDTLRIHFNLPANVKPDDLFEVTVDPWALDAGADPRYGLEIYFNNVLVKPLTVIRPADLGHAITTARFTAGSVNAAAGSGYDNIITLKGTSYASQNGGTFLHLDYLKLAPIPRITFPWAVGRDDDGWPSGDGGGPNTSFVQENGGINPLPGRPDNPEVNQQGDNDYYFSGEYTTTIGSVTALYGAYTPIGIVLANEEGAERAFAAADNDLRYHFNLPTTLNPDDQLQVTFDAVNLDDPGAVNTDPRYGIAVYFNGVLVQSEIVIRRPQLGVDYTTPPFTLASVNAQTGLGYDNIVSLKGHNFNSEGGGNWMGIDYVQLNPVPLKLNPPVLNNNQVTLTWTGNGQLQWASSLLGPWNNVDPRPNSGYSEALVPGENRFYRLVR